MPKRVSRRLFAGLSLDRVFGVALLLVAAFGAWGLIDSDGMSGASPGSPMCLGCCGGLRPCRLAGHAHLADPRRPG